MKNIKEMSLSEAIDYADYLLDWDERGDSVDNVKEVVSHIRDLTRWVPVDERLPSVEDANYHEEVLVNLDPMSAINSPCGITGIETVYWYDVSPKSHTHWKKTTEPEEV